MVILKQKVILWLKFLVSALWVGTTSFFWTMFLNARGQIMYLKIKLTNCFIFSARQQEYQRTLKKEKNNGRFVFPDLTLYAELIYIYIACT